VSLFRALWSAIEKQAAPSIVSKRNYYDFVDGLRGIAVLMVILVHVAQSIGAGTYLSGSIESYVNAGARGVQLFFILSAFTLFSSNSRRASRENRPLLNFYIRRAFRILPFWWVMAAVWLTYGAVHDHQLMLNSFFLTVTFLFGFFRFNPSLELIPGGWSLFVEETFYLILPFISKRLKSLYDAVGVTILLLFLSILWMRLRFKIPIFAQNSFAYLSPPTQWFIFGLGIIGFYAIAHPHIRAFLLNKRASLLIDVLTYMSLALLIGEFYGSNLALLMLFLASFSPSTLFGRLTRNPFLRLFGKYAYSLYLLQFIVLELLRPYTNLLCNTTFLKHFPYEARLAIFYPL
jgi:peptidoglycan/LPS O-acetylase OafA/YrhL